MQLNDHGGTLATRTLNQFPTAQTLVGVSSSVYIVEMFESRHRRICGVFHGQFDPYFGTLHPPLRRSRLGLRNLAQQKSSSSMVP